MNIWNPERYYLTCSLGNLLLYRWTKGNELIIELKIKQSQIPEIVKDAHIALRYLYEQGSISLLQNCIFMTFLLCIEFFYLHVL